MEALNSELSSMSSQLKDWLNPVYWKLYQEQSLRSRYVQRDPYEHVILDDFLTDTAFQYLLEIAEASPRERNTSRAGLSRDRDILWGYLNDVTSIRMFFGREFRDFVSHLAGERAHIQKASFPQLTEFCAGSKGFSVHNDEYETFDWVFLLYLRNTDVSAPAGTFRVHRKIGEEFHMVKDIHALPNRLLCFKVGHESYHSVQDLLATQSRLNLTLDWILPDSERALRRAHALEDV